MSDGSHVVIGASVAGLLAAAALAPNTRSVTVFERRERPAPDESLAPQGRMPHVLLLGGVEAIEGLLPGFRADLHARGAVGVLSHEGRWWNGGYRAEFHDSDVAPFASRVLVERCIRERVEALPNVEIRYGTGVDALLGDAGRVTGVTADRERYDAEVVVDASGRNSHVDRWLEAIGAPIPEIDEVAVDVAYAGALVPAPNGRADRYKYLVCQSMFPEHPRIGLALAIEGDRWAILMGGYHGDRPPRDPAGFRAFAATLAMTELSELVEAVDLDEILTYRFASNRRRRFENVAVPDGFVPIGDTLCSFNPVYGQGMSVAAQEAVVLAEATRRGGISTRRLMARLARIVDGPWRIAADADLGHPRTEGHRRPKPVDRWVRRVLHATTIDPAVARTMMRVTGLQDPPAALFRPTTVARTLRAGRPAVTPSTVPQRVGRR